MSHDENDIHGPKLPFPKVRELRDVEVGVSYLQVEFLGIQQTVVRGPQNVADHIIDLKLPVFNPARTYVSACVKGATSEPR